MRKRRFLFYFKWRYLSRFFFRWPIFEHLEYLSVSRNVCICFNTFSFQRIFLKCVHLILYHLGNGLGQTVTATRYCAELNWLYLLITRSPIYCTSNMSSSCQICIRGFHAFYFCYLMQGVKNLIFLYFA